MAIDTTLNGREFDKFVESPSRAGKTAVEVVLANQPHIEIRNASEIISALKCVYAVNATSVGIASSDFLTQANVLGVALTAAQTNEVIQSQTFGTLRDSSFNWATGTLLYVSSNGSLTDVQPTTGFRTVVATSQGPGSISINIQETITL